MSDVTAVAAEVLPPQDIGDADSAHSGVLLVRVIPMGWDVDAAASAAHDLAVRYSQRRRRGKRKGWGAGAEEGKE